MNDIITIRIQSSGQGINLLVYVNSQPEFIELAPTEDVLLACSNRLSKEIAA